MSARSILASNFTRSGEMTICTGMGEATFGALNVRGLRRWERAVTLVGRGPNFASVVRSASH